MRVPYKVLYIAYVFHHPNQPRRSHLFPYHAIRSYYIMASSNLKNGDCYEDQWEREEAEEEMTSVCTNVFVEPEEEQKPL